MEGCLFGVVVIIGLAILFLKGFDAVAGRGPKQVSDGIDRSRSLKPTYTPPVAPAGEERIPCPVCAEMIMKAAKKCRFCGHVIEPS